MSSNKPKQKRFKINLNEWKANVESLPEPHTYAVPDMKNLLEAARRGNEEAVETMWKASKAATYGPTKYRKGSFNGATQRRRQRKGGKRRKTLKKNKRKVMRRKRKTNKRKSNKRKRKNKRKTKKYGGFQGNVTPEAIAWHRQRMEREERRRAREEEERRRERERIAAEKVERERRYYNSRARDFLSAQRVNSMTANEKREAVKSHNQHIDIMVSLLPVAEEVQYGTPVALGKMGALKERVRPAPEGIPEGIPMATNVTNNVRGNMLGRMVRVGGRKKRR